MTDEIRETHESFGMIGFSRGTRGGAGTNLFGSSIRHPHTITCRIKRAMKERSLNRDAYYGRDTLIEVEMSPMQFADAITALNVGDGVPCTIRYLERTAMEECPEETMRQQFEQEFKDSCHKATEAAGTLVERAQELLGQKTLKVADRKELLEVLRKIQMDLESNLPFIGEQFNRAVDKVITDARSSVEAFFLQRTNELGIKCLQGGEPLTPTPAIEVEG
jgi:uncharacterized protein with von Willebrand factor type A (vWA) domain